MIKCEFEYDREFVAQIAKNSTRVTNIILEICMFIILVATAIVFVMGELITGAVFAVMFVSFLVLLPVVNRSAYKVNNILLGQRVELEFNKDDMLFKAYVGKEMSSEAVIKYSVIKKINEIKGLVYLYIARGSAIVIPINAFDSRTQYQKAMELAGNNYSI